MCLLTNQKNRKTTNADITVYKVVLDVGYKQEFDTPFMRSTVKIGTEYISDLILDDTIHYPAYPKEVNLGIHSILTLEDAIKMYKVLDRPGHICRIVECVIPKKAKIVKGVFMIAGDRLKSIASDRIKYVKVINPGTK